MSPSQYGKDHLGASCSYLVQLGAQASSQSSALLVVGGGRTRTRSGGVGGQAGSGRIRWSWAGLVGQGRVGDGQRVWPGGRESRDACGREAGRQGVWIVGL